MIQIIREGNLKEPVFRFVCFDELVEDSKWEILVHIKKSISQRRSLVLHKNIDYESLLSFVQDNPNAGISLTISENEFD